MIVQNDDDPFGVVVCHRFFLGQGNKFFLPESLILAQDERWRRA